MCDLTYPILAITKMKHGGEVNEFNSPFLMGIVSEIFDLDKAGRQAHLSDKIETYGSRRQPVELSNGFKKDLFIQQVAPLFSNEICTARI